MTPALRVTSFFAGFSIALVATGWWIIERLDAAAIEVEQLTRHNVVEYYHARVDAWAERKKHPDEVNVAFLGDSMVVSSVPALQIPPLVQARLHRMDEALRHVAVDNIGLAGTGVYDYYFLADVIEGTDPELVVIGLNLASFSQNFQTAFARPELAAWLAPGDALESLFLPMDWIGLTADRLLFSLAVVSAGGFDLWVGLNEQQLRVEKVRERVEAALAMGGPYNDWSPEEHFRKRRANRLLLRNHLEGGKRLTAVATLDQYGRVLDGLAVDHPVLEMLTAAVRAHAARGADVLVYLNPVNIEHIESLGVMNRAGLDESIRRIAEATTTGGGHFLDLHALLPDEGFRDRSGHFAHEAGIHAPRIVSAKIAQAIEQLIRQSERGAPE